MVYFVSDTIRIISLRKALNNENSTKKPSETDWSRIDALTDETIDTSDIPPLTEEFFAKAQWRMPRSNVQVTVEVEAEILEWYKAQGEHYKKSLAAALRIYALAHQLPAK